MQLGTSEIGHEEVTHPTSHTPGCSGPIDVDRKNNKRHNTRHGPSNGVRIGYFSLNGACLTNLNSSTTMASVRLIIHKNKPMALRSFHHNLEVTACSCQDLISVTG